MSRDFPGPEFTALLHPHTGDVTALRSTPLGNMSDVTALVECEEGSFFVKAVRNRPGGRRDSLVREGLINPHVQPVSPAVLWQAEDDAWLVLGFEAVQGRAADLGPGSPDLPKVIDVLNRIAALSLSEIARDWTETRWDRFTTGQADTAMLRGDALLYTDINVDNLMIGHGAVWAVDWAWPTRGAAFIDPALLVVQLIADGHPAASAETQAAGCTAWQNADPQAVDAFAAANLRMWRQHAERHPDASWPKAMEAAAQTWADHRGLTPTR